MKNKLWNKIYVIYFLILCIMPIGLMPFVSSELSENRELSGFPSFITEEGINLDFFNECSDYVADHFAFRSQLVSIDSNVKYSLFHTPSDKQVILGKDGWMFFEGSLKDYAGVTLSDEKLDQIAENLENVCSYFHNMGKETVIMIVPNKNSIYPEYMPDYFGKPDEVNNRILLQEKMAQREIPYLDVADILLSAKNQDELYLHQDTHWNNTGARLVLNALYKKLGVDYVHTLDDYTVEVAHESDLSKILFPTKENLEAQRVYQVAHAYDYKKRVRSMDDLNIVSNTRESVVDKKIFLFRDSFGRAMIPNMAEVFEEGQYNRSTPYDIEKAADSDCDMVVIEIVERNIADLGDIIVP